MLVHASNYRVVGFTHQVSLAELVELGARHQLPVVHDIGSGAVIPSESAPLSEDPIASESIRAGADLVLFSGDKLLGGPQCGIIVGRQEYVSRLANHPMSRALRLDKMTLAALQATLGCYIRSGLEHPSTEIPFVRLLETPVEQLEQRAANLIQQLSQTHSDWHFTAEPSTAYTGGGAMPGTELPSCALAISHPEYNPNAVAQRLRLGTPAVVGRVHDNQLLLDLRCLEPEEDLLLLTAVTQLCNS